MSFEPIGPESASAPPERGRMGRVFVVLAVLEGLALLPLACYLPTSAAALGLALGLFTAQAVVILALVPGQGLAVALQVASAALAGVCFLIARMPALLPSTLGASIAIGGMTLALIWAGVGALPRSSFRLSFAVHEFALASTAICWLLLAPLRLTLGMGPVGVAHDSQESLYFLFIAPLGFALVPALAMVRGWTQEVIALGACGACLYAIGLFETGMRLDDAQPILVLLVLVAVLVLRFSPYLEGGWAER